MSAPDKFLKKGKWPGMIMIAWGLEGCFRRRGPSRQAALGRWHLNFDLKVQKAPEPKTLNLRVPGRGTKKCRYPGAVSWVWILRAGSWLLCTSFMDSERLPPEGEDNHAEWIWRSLWALWVKQFMSDFWHWFCSTSRFKGYRICSSSKQRL